MAPQFLVRYRRIAWIAGWLIALGVILRGGWFLALLLQSESIEETKTGAFVQPSELPATPPLAVGSDPIEVPPHQAPTLSGKAAQEAPALRPSGVKPMEPLAARPKGTVDAALGRLASGHAAFNVPSEATIGASFVVEAKVSASLSKKALAESIAEPGEVAVEPVSLSKWMSATLSGGSAFEITAASPKEQWVSESKGAVWIWSVTPKRPGEQALILSLDALLKVEEREGWVSLGVLRRRIAVAVDPLDEAVMRMAWVRGIAENLYWLLTVLIAPIALFIWRKIMGRRRRTATPPDDS